MARKALVPVLAAVLVASCATGSTGLTGTSGAGSTGGASSSSSVSTASAGGTGGAPCDGPEVSCAGACVDTSSDPANCGSCGHGCLGGECAAGACQSVVVASGQAEPKPILASGGFVYWGNTGSPGGIGRESRTGGAAEVAVPGAIAVDLAIDAVNLYWVTSGSMGSVMAAPLSGGTPVALAMGQDSPASIGQSGFYVYWVDETSLGSVDQVSTTPGGTPSLLANSQTFPHRIALDATRAYWTTQSGGVWAVALGGSPVQQIAGGQDDPYGIAVDAANVYWTNRAGGAVMQQSLSGGSPVTVASMQDGATGIAVDATRVYWTAALDGKVLSAPIGGGATPVVLASGLSSPWGIAVDDVGVYWTDVATGVVAKIAK
jgi:Stigma-specific protein, Stig1